MPTAGVSSAAATIRALSAYVSPSEDDSSSATRSWNARTNLPTASRMAPLSDVATPEPPEYGAGGRSLSPISTSIWSMSSPSSSAVTCVAIV